MCIVTFIDSRKQYFTELNTGSVWSPAKVRRLYDIANVLTSLSLIKKVHVREERGRKPAFKWLGPVEFSSCVNAGES